METIEYQGRDIKVIKDNALYINAPDMARFFDKTAPAWLKTKQATDCLKHLQEVAGIEPKDAVRLESIGVGTVKATYMIAPLALEYARALSYPFYLQLLVKMQEQNGVKEDENETIKKAFEILSNRNKDRDETIKAQRAKLKELEKKNEQIIAIVKQWEE